MARLQIRTSHPSAKDFRVAVPWSCFFILILCQADSITNLAGTDSITNLVFTLTIFFILLVPHPFYLNRFIYLFVMHTFIRKQLN